MLQFPQDYKYLWPVQRVIQFLGCIASVPARPCHEGLEDLPKSLQVMHPLIWNLTRFSDFLIPRNESNGPAQSGQAGSETKQHTERTKRNLIAMAHLNQKPFLDVYSLARHTHHRERKLRVDLFSGRTSLPTLPLSKHCAKEHFFIYHGSTPLEFVEGPGI